MRTAVVIVAAGSGRRFGGSVPKQLTTLAGAPVLEWAVRAFRRHPAIQEIVVVLPAGLSRDPPAWLRDAADVLVTGGPTRTASVAAGVDSVGPSADIILVHDGVRPFVSQALIGRVCALATSGPVVPVVPVGDTIKEVETDGRVRRTLARESLRRAQTPQGFPAALLRERLRCAVQDGVEATDDAALCEGNEKPVRTVKGDPLNVKITTREDLEYARWLAVHRMSLCPPA